MNAVDQNAFLSHDVCVYAEAKVPLQGVREFIEVSLSPLCLEGLIQVFRHILFYFYPIQSISSSDISQNPCFLRSPSELETELSDAL